MTDITIPPEALEAGARAVKLLMQTNDRDSAFIASAAFLAMIEAWPDSAKGYSSTWWGQKTLMLPIGEENPNV